MKGTGTVTVPQLSVSILPRDRLVGTDVKLFLLSCCLTPAPPLQPGNPSLPSWITTRFRFSLPCCLSLGVSLLMSPIRVQVDDGLSIRVLAGMSGGVVTNLSDKPFTGGVLDDELSCNRGLLPRNRRTWRTNSAPRAPNCLLLLLLPVVGLPRSLSVNLPLSFPLSLFCSLMLSTVSLLSLLPSLLFPFLR